MRLIAAIILTIASNASAQLPYGKLDWIFPPGGQAGTEIETTIGGADVDLAETLVFSHPGITAVQKQTAATEFETAQPIPHQFTIRIADYVPSGIYDVQAVGRFGASTPRAYQVGNSPERVEPGDNQTPDKALELTIGETINGRANANGADFCRLKLTKDQRILVHCAASEIDSQMDATLSILDAQGRELAVSRDDRGRDPFIDFMAAADGDYLVTVYDFTYLGGNNYFYRLTATDKPVIEFVFPPAIAPGTTETLTLYGWNLPNGEIHETWTIHGRPMESVTASVTAPLLDPLGVSAKPLGVGEPIAVELAGFQYRYKSNTSASNPFFIAFAQAPVVREHAENNHATSAQRLAVPCEVAGQFFPARDDDWFEFEAKKGDVWWLELFSQRQGVPTDPYMLIQRVQKKEDGTEQRSDVAEIDDGPKRSGGKGFETPSGDPVYRLNVGEDGVYRVLVRDLLGESRARPQNFYRLVIRRTRPDYHLLVTTQSPFNPDPAQPMRWTPVLRRGGSIALPVSVVRVDGFDEPIEVSVAGLPNNVAAPPVIIGSNQDAGVLSITASESAPNWSGPIEVLGIARQGGRNVVRTANFSTLVWDTPAQNAMMTPRITQGAVLRISDDIAPLQVAMNAGNERVATSRGGILTIPFSLTRRGEIKDKVTLGPTPLPGGVKAEIKLADNADQGEIVLTVEPGAKPGDYSFCLTGKTKISYRRLPDRVETAESERKAVETTVSELAAAQTMAAEALAAAENESKAHSDTLAAAQQEFTSLTEQANVPADQRAAAEQKLNAAKEEAVASEAAKLAATSAATAAQQRHNAAQEALKRLAERVTQLTENAKPGDRNIDVASNPVTLQIVPDPITLTLPAEITMTVGSEQKLSLGMQRLYGFGDAVRVEPSVADANAKLTVAAIDIPADQTAGDVMIQSAADSAVGKHSLTLKAKLKFNNFDLELQRVTHVNIVAPAPPDEKPPTEKPAEKTE